MDKFVLFLFLMFNIYVVHSQNVYPIDTLNNMITFKRVKTIFKIERKKHIEKSFYIDIPQNIPFRYYKNNVAEKIHGLIFTNDTACVVIQINKKKNRNNIFYHDSYEKLNYQNIPVKLVSVEGIQFDKKLYCGYYYYKNYFVYYYNVPYEKVELFNSSLKSIRRKK